MAVSVFAYIEVRESEVHGQGLFAVQPLTPGTILGYVRGRMAPHYEDEHPYALTLSDGLVLIVEGPLAYINHGRPDNVSYNDDGAVEVLRVIEPGEELLADYGKDWEA